MRNEAIALAGFALVATNGAGAADFGSSRSYAPAPAVFAAYNWMGPYIGGNIGLQWGNTTRNPTKPSGVLGGLQAGYNWQGNHLVVGVETDIQASSADDVLAPWKFANPWFGTARARAGYAWKNVLLYGTTGFAYGGLELTSGGITQNRTHFGWTIGAGAEIGLTPNWTAKVEYLFFDLADRNYFIGTSHGMESNLVRVGVNYKF
jgi:outer membrane immunogenic protein